MRRLGLLITSALAIAGCGLLDRGQPIPAGAQQVHVTIVDGTVRLAPDTVRAGPTYLVVDDPPDGGFAFVSGTGSGGTAEAPLAPGAVERLERGDTEGTSISGFSAGGCDAAQNAADRGKTGPCGNVMMVALGPGTYALAAEPLEIRDEGAPPVPITVLTVTP